MKKSMKNNLVELLLFVSIDKASIQMAVNAKRTVNWTTYKLTFAQTELLDFCYNYNYFLNTKILQLYIYIYM